MFATIRIGDKDVGMLANAASPYIFKQVFGEDLMTKFTKMKTEADNSIGENWVLSLQSRQRSVTCRS